MNPTVMPGLVPGIHVFRATMKKDVGGPAWASGSDAVLRTAMPGHGENVLSGGAALVAGAELLDDRRQERLLLRLGAAGEAARHLLEGPDDAMIGRNLGNHLA